VDTPLDESAALALAKMAGFALVTAPLAVLVLQAALRRSRSRGTIIEY
jgi:hypothetical protein